MSADIGMTEEEIQQKWAEFKPGAMFWAHEWRFPNRNGAYMIVLEESEVEHVPEEHTENSLKILAWCVPEQQKVQVISRFFDNWELVLAGNDNTSS